MSRIDDETLREVLCNDVFPGIAYMLIWGELDKHSDGYRALSKVLFDDDFTRDPDNAPNRDFSDPEVRRGVFQCAMEHADVRAAVEKVLAEIAAGGRKKPWWRFW
jgi:hypothetical protein